MAEQLPLRRLWVMYRDTAASVIGRRYERMIARHSFYAGAQSALSVLDTMLRDGEYEELHETIRRHGRLIQAIARLAQPRKRRH
jgi:hypothetical protein